MVDLLFLLVGRLVGLVVGSFWLVGRSLSVAVGWPVGRVDCWFRTV